MTVRREENLISGVDGCGVQLQKKTQAASSAVGLVERMFPLTEVLEIGESKAACWADHSLQRDRARTGYQSDPEQMPD